MPGDRKSPPAPPPPPPTTVEELAAMMTKLISGLETRMEERISSAEARWSAPPNPSASMPYGMPGYGSTSLASSSPTAPALSTAPPTTAPSLPITSIPFPHSPSPIPSTFDVPAFVPHGAPSTPGTGGLNKRLGVPRFSKIDFPSYDGTDDPLN